MREAGDGLLEVTMDGVVARVGSTLNQARDVWQVKLRKGELLEMLDPGPGESGAWYRVAPPSGEFRWVYGRYVHPVSGEGEVQEADGSVQVEPEPVARSRREDQSVRPARAEEMVRSAARRMTAGWRKSLAACVTSSRWLMTNMSRKQTPSAVM